MDLQASIAPALSATCDRLRTLAGYGSGRESFEPPKCLRLQPRKSVRHGSWFYSSSFLLLFFRFNQYPGFASPLVCSVVLKVTLSFVTCVLQQVVTLFLISRKGECNGPGLCVNRRVINPGFVMNGVPIDHRVSLHNTCAITLKIPGLIEPLLSIEICIVHNQRIAFPTSDAVRMP